MADPETRKCCICGTEFGMMESKCPSCKTAYQISLKKSLESSAGCYSELRTSGFEDDFLSKEQKDEGRAVGFLKEGLKLAETEDYLGAERRLRRAAVLDPNNSEVAFYLGSAFFKLGRYIEARDQWHRAIALNPGDERSKKWYGKVTQLLRAPF